MNNFFNKLILLIFNITVLSCASGFRVPANAVTGYQNYVDLKETQSVCEVNIDNAKSNTMLFFHFYSLDHAVFHYYSYQLAEKDLSKLGNGRFIAFLEKDGEENLLPVQQDNSFLEIRILKLRLTPGTYQFAMHIYGTTKLVPYLDKDANIGFGPFVCEQGKSYTPFAQSKYKIEITKNGQYYWRRLWIENSKSGEVVWKKIEIDPSNPSKPSDNSSP